jgi:hypothetical protein
LTALFPATDWNKNAESLVEKCRNALPKNPATLQQADFSNGIDNSGA